MTFGDLGINIQVTVCRYFGGDKMDFGTNLRNLRKQKGWSQTTLSEITGIPQTTISDLENNKFSPNIETVSILANSFGISISTILEENSLSRGGGSFEKG